MFLQKPAPTFSMVHRSNSLIAFSAGKHWMLLHIYFNKRESKRVLSFSLHHNHQCWQYFRP